ncbi:MAG: LysM peptidoglycan-binding domain-containing protein [Anaerolineae bacterium]|nr:LysM peptidoglycan-binding domain-containing protein [Anaerolineae bacterium]
MKRRTSWRWIAISVVVASLVVLLLPGPAMACAPTYHRVQPGETLSSIAARYGVSVWRIAQANGIANANYIYVGQLLRIPVCYPSAPGPRRVHVVRPGETLAMIAARYGVNLWRLARVNGIWNINRIYVGQRLIIPGYYAPAPSPWPPYPYPPAPSPAPPSPSCSTTPTLGFGRVWNSYPGVRAALGCPKASEFSVDATQQRFQHAVIIWRADENRFWALWNNHTWGEYAASEWYNVAWRLGWAVDAGTLTKVSVQDFDGGHMLWTSSLGIYVLYNGGAWQHFD